MVGFLPFRFCSLSVFVSRFGVIVRMLEEDEGMSQFPSDHCHLGVAVVGLNSCHSCLFFLKIFSWKYLLHLLPCPLIHLYHEKPPSDHLVVDTRPPLLLPHQYLETQKLLALDRNHGRSLALPPSTLRQCPTSSVFFRSPNLL